MLSLYLRDLERELSRHLPEDDVQTRLAEIETHLRDGVEARVELGLGRDVAEKDAVAAFGEVEQVARFIVRDLSVVARLTAVGGTFVVLAILSFISYWMFQISAWTGCLPFIAVLAGAAWLAIGSFRSKRAAPIPVTAVGFAGAVALSLIIGLNTLDLSRYGGQGSVPRWEIEDLLHQSRERRVEKFGSSDVIPGDEFIREAENDPAGNFISCFDRAIGPSAEIACGAVLIDFTFAALGGDAARRRRRRNRIA